MVLPEVRYWELVESYGMQTLCECRERRRGHPAVVNSRKNCRIGEDAGWYGRRRAYFSWQESSGEGTRQTPTEAQWPEENSKPHRGQAKLDQQRVQTARGRNCKTGGIAREPQSSKRNTESGVRGNQDSQRRPSERGRNDGQKHELLLVSGKHRRNSNARTTRTGVLERVGVEETGWVDSRWFSGGNR